ncbi:MAG: hypothetical protein ACFBSF_20070 [Leptolyngbyaceae cyanobacterium]
MGLTLLVILRAFHIPTADQQCRKTLSHGETCINKAIAYPNRKNARICLKVC